MTDLISMTNESTWVIDPNGPADLVRRMQWDRLVSEGLGLFPESLDLSTVYRILEVGCGPGEWTLATARYFPVFYVGIDTNPMHIAYAQAMAKTVAYDDLVRFEQADLSKPLPFVDAAFDLVHLRFLLPLLPTKQWLQLLHEAWRVLPMGGIVLLCEAEWPSTTSPAAQHLVELIAQALSKAGYGLCMAGATPALTESLPALLREQTGGMVEEITHTLPFSARSLRSEAIVNHLRATAHLMQPFLTRMGCGSQAELSALCEQIFVESQREAFAGSITITQAWASKGQEEN